MNKLPSDDRIIRELCFRLLPAQIMLAAVNAVNGLVSGIFATNFVGQDAMSAVGLYSPLSLVIGAVSALLLGGSQILSAEYKGSNSTDRFRDIFMLDMELSVLISAVLTLALFLGGALRLGRLFTADVPVQSSLNIYLMGMALSVLPQVLGQQLSGYLSLENRAHLTLAASIAYVVINLLLNWVFIVCMHMQVLGLALSSSLGLWAYCLIQAVWFLRPDADVRFSLQGIKPGDVAELFRIGIPGALSYAYLSFRGLAVNAMLTRWVGSDGLSAFTACNSLMNIFWTIPTGMLAVSRMLMSVSIGEEDRHSLQDVMRNVFRRYIPLMCGVCVLIIVCARPFTRLFYQDVSAPVFSMTEWGFRFLPFCMPTGIVVMHFICYGQASGKNLFVHILVFLDSVVTVTAFTALLIPFIGMNSVYIANVMNGIVSCLFILGHAVLMNRRLPVNMAELMVIPPSFGVPEDALMDLSVRTMEEVTTVAAAVQSFYEGSGVDRRRSMLAGLALEEMAGNVVDHGFSKDSRPHSVDIRAVHKDDSLILRIRDDCRPFDPDERRAMTDPADKASNIGIRMVYAMAESVRYQNLLGLNVLTIRI